MRPVLVVLCLACLAGGSWAQETPSPRPSTRAPRDEVFKMLDAYIVSNLQDSLDLTDEQFVKILPLVKRVQTGRREYAQRRSAVIAEMSRLFESGGATEARIAELMTDLKAMESEGPVKLRRDVDALDSMLTPVQQAKLRILEVQVEHRIRDLMARMRSDSAAGRRHGPTPRKGAGQQDDTPSP